MLIYLVAIFFTVNKTIKNHYGTIFLLSPIPFLIGLNDIFKNTIEGMQELEMSLRINYKQWLLSKLFIIANFNALLNFIYSIILFNMNLTGSFLRLTLYWCVPFLIISGIGLLLVAKVRGNYTSVTILAFWFAVSEYVQSSESVIEWMKNLNLAIYVLAITISFAFLIYEVKVILIKTSICLIFYPSLLGDIFKINENWTWVRPFIDLSISQTINANKLFANYKSYNIFGQPVLYPFISASLILMIAIIPLLVTRTNIIKRDAY